MKLMEQLIENVVWNTENFLKNFIIGKASGIYETDNLSGEFALYQGQSSPDLYGMLDAVYILYILGKLRQKTDKTSRKIWANRILACQDENGWFSRLNLRGHADEHATAYAIGALKLLEVEPEEQHLNRIESLAFLKPILTDHGTFLNWIKNLNFCFSSRSILKKNLGWHHIWRGSHIGGGIAAIIVMTNNQFKQWLCPCQIDTKQWLITYFNWLDDNVNPETGYWQRAIWNKVFRRPTLIDMGGAVHFYWIYEATERLFPYPEQVIQSTLSLQKNSGLYKKHPFCIDLDGNYCIIRSFLQLPRSKQKLYHNRVYSSVQNNFESIVNALLKNPLDKMYSNSHGLPGALAALIECSKLPDFKYAELIGLWQNPFDKVCWL